MFDATLLCKRVPFVLFLVLIMELCAFGIHIRCYEHKLLYLVYNSNAVTKLSPVMGLAWILASLVIIYMLCFVLLLATVFFES